MLYFSTRSENATLKKLRKQQEQALAEVVHQKEEVMRWVAEEKQRTQKWCDEQQQLAVKERNAAAKMVKKILNYDKFDTDWLLNA